MSSLLTSQVWALEHPKGPSRLLLLAMADCASQRGQVTVSTNELAKMCAVSKTRVQTLQNELLEGGFIRKIGDTNTTTKIQSYSVVVTPDLRPKETTRPLQESADIVAPRKPLPPEAHASKHQSNEAPEIIRKPPARTETTTPRQVMKGHPQNDVGEILTAAGIPPRSDMPFYWMRAEHLGDIPDLLEALGVHSVAEAIATLKKIAKATAINGIQREQPQRLTDLAKQIGPVT